MASGLLLGIRLGFHHHTPEQAAVLLSFHQQAANQLRGDQLGRAGEEGLGEGRDITRNQPNRQEFMPKNYEDLS